MEPLSLKDKIKEELKKLKALTFRKKLEYIWDYYKPLMAGVIGVIVVIAVVVNLILGSRITTELTVAFFNHQGQQEDEQQLHQDFLKFGDLDGKDQEVLFDTTYMINTEGNDQFTMTNRMKLMASIEAQTLDVLLLPEELFLEYMEAGAFLELDGGFAEQAGDYESYFVTGLAEGADRERVYGLDLTGNDKLKNFYGQDKVILAVVGNTKHLNNVEKFVQYLLS